MRDLFWSHLLLFFLPDSPNSNWRSREGLRSESRILMQNPNKRNVPSFKFNNKVKIRFWHFHKDNRIKGYKSDGLLRVRKVSRVQFSALDLPWKSINQTLFISGNNLI